MTSFVAGCSLTFVEIMLSDKDRMTRSTTWLGFWCPANIRKLMVEIDFWAVCAT